MIDRYEISKLAQVDLEEIWIYTYENWSIKQANKYYEFIIEEFKKICAFPEIGKSIEEVKPNHKILPVQSHLIVYKVSDQTLYIVRILHKQMDIDFNLID